MTPELSRRALGRATLARQLLLERADLSPLAAIEHLVGMQAQAPLAPYVGLWTRLVAVKPAEVSELIASARAVRGSLQRATLHLASVRDYRRWRPLVDPVLSRGFHGQRFSKNLAGLDLDEVLNVGRALLRDQPLTRAKLGRALAERFPGRDAESLSHAVCYLVPLVHLPPRGLWGATGAPTLALGEDWIGADLDRGATVDELVRRYLAAFGPASVADAQAFSGLTRLAEVFDRLRPGLLVLRGPAGRELFDLPDAPRPDADVPAPVRFLPEYDNLLLGHADRTRVNPEGHPVPLYPGNGASRGELLIDGQFAGLWAVERGREATTLTLDPFAPLAESDLAEASGEGEALVRFLTPDAPSVIVRLAQAAS
jgi:hypothetical protein